MTYPEKAIAEVEQIEAIRTIVGAERRVNRITRTINV